ncbi:DUF934 domain-containing protein [Psychrobacter sp. I-STPA6b]|uniref:DUF934 domain-containing protein n=1 Tax=Psychrobacter sp. I-STPA6b TaxID=2585718 RepID=UPI001D0C791A|nr:DUF934 domain-containing protein [Psychrobacter sp. I-STPA6b]
MANHHILDQQGQDISANDTWHALAHEQLPDGVALAELNLGEILHKQEKLDIILPIQDLLTALNVNSPLLQEVLALVNQHSSRLATWLSTDTTLEQLDELAEVLDIDDSLAEEVDADGDKSKAKAKPKKRKKDAPPTIDPESLHKIELVVIYVPAFADGRGFSLAKHLRQIGYQGEIRMAGAFGRDQIAYLRRSGVDSFVIAEQDMSDDIAQSFNDLASAYAGTQVSKLPMFR